jgi:hypothetical protein
MISPLFFPHLQPLLPVHSLTSPISIPDVPIVIHTLSDHSQPQPSLLLLCILYSPRPVPEAPDATFLPPRAAATCTEPKSIEWPALECLSSRAICLYSQLCPPEPLAPPPHHIFRCSCNDFTPFTLDSALSTCF